MTRNKQAGLFGAPTDPLWEGMPEFHQEDLRPWRTVKVHLSSEEDYRAFRDAIGAANLRACGYMNTRSFWFPPREPVSWTDRHWVSTTGHGTPRYPVYIISKGRARTGQTARELAAMGVPFSLVVEPQEADEYRAWGVGPVLVLPFSNLGQGSIPARSWVWDHATSTGAARHWILDDNIAGFHRTHQNTEYRMGDGSGFRVVEDLADRYENVPMAGLEYKAFVPTVSPTTPVHKNTRVYSMILLSNAERDRIGWRGRFNEDTDLSLRYLKRGDCTLLCNAFTGHKVATQTMGGGNTHEVYGDTDERREFAESLQRQHPDVVTIRREYGRWHFSVDYRGFQANRLEQRPDADLTPRDYGLRLVDRPRTP
jgi:hypothetical protein